MADFFVVLSSAAESALIERRFSQGLGLSRELLGQQPTTVHRGAGFRAAAFPRRDGTGGAIAVDAASSSWALAAGTWFHDRGFASGGEPRLLERFLEVGAETLAREIDGFFTIVLGDARSGETFVITDAVGSHHAFSRVESGAVTLSGSSLVLAGMGPEDLDPLGAQEFVRSGSLHEGRTVHFRVRRLGAGRVHRLRDGAFGGATTYWRPSSAPRNHLDGAEAADALYGALGDVGRRIATVEPRILADLTGGYDSRAIAAGFLGAKVPFATTVTGTADSGDVRTAQRLAKTARLDHRWVPPMQTVAFADVARMLAFTDGEYDTVEYAQIFAVQNAFAHEFGVGVHGSAGEIARGRLWMHLMPHIGRPGPIDATALVARRFRDARSDPALFPAGQRLDLQRHFREMIARETADLSGFPNTLQCDAVFLALRMSNWQGRIASSTDRLRRCVGPFLFRSVLDTMLSMTMRTRYRSRVIREMLARHQPALARVPMGRGYPPLPFGPRTALAFWPLPLYYATRAVTKIGRVAGLPLAAASTAGIPPSPRLALWKEEPVRDLFRPEAMRTAAVLDAARIDGFLDASRRPDFPFEGAWNRLLTLETVLRRLETARAAAARQERQSGNQNGSERDSARKGATRG